MPWARPCWGVCSGCCCLDDPVTVWRSSVAGDGLHGYAQGLSVVGAEGPGGAARRSPERPPVLLPRAARRSVEGDLARRARRLPVHEAAGAGALSVAECGRWRGDDLACTAWLSSLRHRLASSPGDVAAAQLGGMRFCL